MRNLVVIGSKNASALSLFGVLRCALTTVAAITLLISATAKATEKPYFDGIEVTLNGEPLDNQLFFYGSYYLLEPHERCSPASDEYLRELVVENVLFGRWLHDNAKAGNLTNSSLVLESFSNSERDAKSTKEYLETIDSEHQYYDALHFNVGLYYFFPDVGKYKDAVPPSILDVTSEYDRLVESEHPLVRNLVAIRVKPVAADSKEKAAQIKRLFDEGQSIESIRKAMAIEIWPWHDAVQWLAVMPSNVNDVPDFLDRFWRERLDNWDTDIKEGDVLGPYVRWDNIMSDSVGKLVWEFYQVAERRDIKQLPLKGGIGDHKGITFEWVKRFLYHKNYKELVSQLRQDAQVHVNGKLVDANYDFNGCGNATKESAAYFDAFKLD